MFYVRMIQDNIFHAVNSDWLSLVIFQMLWRGVP